MCSNTLGTSLFCSVSKIICHFPIFRVIPHMDQLDRVLPYLAELGALHQRQGVARWDQYGPKWTKQDTFVPIWTKFPQIKNKQLKIH